MVKVLVALLVVAAVHPAGAPVARATDPGQAAPGARRTREARGAGRRRREAADRRRHLRALPSRDRRRRGDPEVHHAEDERPLRAAGAGHRRRVRAAGRGAGPDAHPDRSRRPRHDAARLRRHHRLGARSRRGPAHRHGWRARRDAALGGLLLRPARPQVVHVGHRARARPVRRARLLRREGRPVERVRGHRVLRRRRRRCSSASG